MFRSRKLRLHLDYKVSVNTTASEYGQAPVTGLGEVATMTELRARFPSLRPLPLVNDEADPEVGWWRARAWRAGVSYPAAVAFNIINHRRRYFGQGHRDIRQLSSLTIENCGSTKNISCFPDNMCFIFSDLICYPMTMRSSPILPLYLHKEHCWQDLRWRILHFQTLSLSRNQFTISFHSKVISKEGGRRANKFLTFRGSYLHKFSAPAGGREWPAPPPPPARWSTAHTRTLELSTQFRECVHSKILKARPSMNNFEFK